MPVFLRLTSIFFSLLGAAAAALLLTGGPSLLSDLLSRPSVDSALILIGGTVGAALFWVLAELLQRARQVSLVLDRANLGESAGEEEGPAPFSASGPEGPIGTGSASSEPGP